MEIKRKMELKDDLFLIPVEDGNLVYSPLHRGLFWASEDASNVVRRYLADGCLDCEDDNLSENINRLSEAKVLSPNSHDTPAANRLVIILSQSCNLACTYCYAQEARSKDVLSKDKLRVVYDFVLADKRKSKYFTYIGGGEPFVAWDIIEWSVNYINKHKSAGDKVAFSVTTNATLFDEHSIHFCRDNNIHIGVSFEIIKNIQDKQRPFRKLKASTFDIINENINKLMDNGISLGIRSTITSINVSLMPEMVRFVAVNYPSLKKVHFEPVTDVAITNYRFYAEFIDYFCISREVGRKLGLEVYNSITNSVFRIKDRFCNGEMCVTPTGSIVACHRISSEKNRQYATFCYGQINENKLSLDMKKYDAYLSFVRKKMLKCKDCFAYWHCAGCCPMERTVFSEEQLSMKCEFTREIIKRILLEQIKGTE